MSVKTSLHRSTARQWVKGLEGGKWEEHVKSAHILRYDGAYSVIASKLFTR